MTTCLPDGVVAEGDACTRGSDGVDDCEKGLVCISGKCAKICAIGDHVACAPQGYCLGYSDLFTEGAKALAGACKLGCNPVTQLTSLSASCGTDMGCYYSDLATGPVATCAQAPANPTSYEQDDPITGNVYVNSCAPGFMPVLDGSGNPVCTATCAPVETWSGSTTDIGGAAPYTCASRGATGYECRFASFQSSFGTSDPLLNSIGLCFDPSARMYDSDGNGSLDTVWPSCADLANTDTDADGIDDNEKWGCAPGTR